MDHQQLIKRRANAKRRFTRTRNALVTLLGKTDPSRGEMVRLWREGDILREDINSIVEELREVFEECESDCDTELDRLDQWCADFDKEWDVFTSVRAKLEVLDVKNVSSKSSNACTLYVAHRRHAFIQINSCMEKVSTTKSTCNIFISDRG